MHKKQQGNRGEKKAEQWLTTQGVKILHRNRTIRGGEIDLIGVMNEMVIFFEIRTLLRTHDILDYMTSVKMYHLYKTAAYRVHQNQYLGAWRVDVIFVGKQSIDRHQNVSNN